METIKKLSTEKKYQNYNTHNTDKQYGREFNMVDKKLIDRNAILKAVTINDVDNPTNAYGEKDYNGMTSYGKKYLSSKDLELNSQLEKQAFASSLDKFIFEKHYKDANLTNRLLIQQTVPEFFEERKKYLVNQMDLHIRAKLLETLPPQSKEDYVLLFLRDKYDLNLSDENWWKMKEAEHKPYTSSKSFDTKLVSLLGNKQNVRIAGRVLGGGLGAIAPNPKYVYEKLVKSLEVDIDKNL